MNHVLIATSEDPHKEASLANIVGAIVTVTSVPREVSYCAH